jgi:6-pyruvoyltetrahydropterin/6-carboxytetrahydropterin synthase
MKFELKTQFRIESARHLPHLPDTHPCSRTHGHSFLIIFKLVGERKEPVGWVRDYHEIDSLARRELGVLDHRILNEIPGLENPTSENLAVWIFEKMKKSLPELQQVTVCETPTTECSYPVRIDSRSI